MRSRKALWLLTVPLVLGVGYIGLRAYWNQPRTPSDPVERTALLLEICEVPTYGREYGQVHPVKDIAPLLLEVAHQDPEAIRRGAHRFIQRNYSKDQQGAAYFSSEAREDLLRVFEEVYWDTEYPHIFRFDTGAGQIRLVGMMPGGRTGIWLPFEYKWEAYLKQKRRRDLRPYEKQRLSPNELDRVILSALRDVPHHDGRWHFDEKPEKVDWFTRLKRLVGLR